MPRLLLAWEFGAGRGHVAALRDVASALGAPGLIDASLCHLTHAGELTDVCREVFQGLQLGRDDSLRRANGWVPSATWGEFVCELGLHTPEYLADCVRWYHQIFESRKIGLVVADYAPISVLAARAAGIKVVGTGAGYGLVPASLPTFPILTNRHTTLIHDEQRMVDAVNEAGAPLGLPPIIRGPEIGVMDDALVRSLPFLDPYAAHRDKPHLPPFAAAPEVLPEGGDEVFAYFSTQELANPAILDAITTLPVSVRLHGPGISDEIKVRIRAVEGMTLLDGPQPVEEIAARSRIMLHSAQHGTATMALGCGLPQVAFPQHLEQEFNADRLAARGTLLQVARDSTDAAAIRDAIMQAYHSAPMHRRARDLAREYGPLIRQPSRPIIRARLNDVMLPGR